MFGLRPEPFAPYRILWKKSRGLPRSCLCYHIKAVSSDDFLFCFGYYFNIFPGNVGIHSKMLGILQCIRRRILFLHWIEFFEKNPSREDSYGMKVYCIKTKGRQVKCKSYTTSSTSPSMFLRIRLLSLKSDSSPHLLHLLALYRNDYLVWWLNQLFNWIWMTSLQKFGQGQIQLYTEPKIVFLLTRAILVLGCVNFSN